MVYQIDTERIEKEVISLLKDEVPFDRNVMNRVLEDGFNHLEASILKWKTIRTYLKINNLESGLESEEGISNCGLCRKYFYRKDENGVRCDGCPVREETGKNGCRDTPYMEWDEYVIDDPEELLSIAEKEVAFLMSLGIEKRKENRDESC